jgi:HK97 family phage major capsid protein
LLRIEPTDKDQVKFMKQTTRTNAAAAKGEGVALDEAAIAYTEATVDIRKIGVYLPVTEEQLEDELEIRNIIDSDLRLMVRQKFDELVTVGDGIAPNILGAYNAANILSQAKGSDPVFDAIMKAMTKVKVSGRAMPNLVLLHANDYQELALARTSDGVYIYGNPTDAPMQRVWGVQIATSEALSEGNGLVMDTNYLRLKMRKDVTIAATDSHGTLFINNVTVLRAHLRAGLQILRDEALCRVTGI